jgi:hypothetical protein
VDVGAPFVSDRQPPKAGEPGQGSFNHPAVSPEPVRALDAAARDARGDGPLAAFGPAAAVVVGLVGVELSSDPTNWSGGDMRIWPPSAS